METMKRYPWPGNVRELANIVERLSIMQPGAEVTGARVREVLQPAATFGKAPSITVAADEITTRDASLGDALDDYERRMIQNAIDSAHGNIAEAARRLQTDRPNLYRRMKRLGIGAQPAEAAIAEEVQ
jgi:two-component system nitrogen regulation response regulator NtrX